MVLKEMMAGFWQIVSAPFKSLEVLWIIVPLLLMWLVLEVYFAKHKTEELGWNTALANGITLGWLALQSMRYLFGGHFEGIWLRFVVNLVILFYAGLIVYFSFSHKISAKWSFLLASPTPVYFLGTFAVLWGFGVLSVDAYVFLDILILYLLVGILIMLFRKMVKPAIV